MWRTGQETFLAVSLWGPAALQKQAPKEREFYIIRSEMFRCPLPFLQLLRVPWSSGAGHFFISAEFMNALKAPWKTKEKEDILFCIA